MMHSFKYTCFERLGESYLWSERENFGMIGIERRERERERERDLYGEVARASGGGRAWVWGRRSSAKGRGEEWETGNQGEGSESVEGSGERDRVTVQMCGGAF